MAASKEVDDDTEHADVGAQLRAAAERLGLTEWQLATRAGLPHGTVVKAFRGGNITLSSFRRIIAALGLEVIEFDQARVQALFPDAAATRAALEELQDLERRLGASRASLEKTVVQRDRDRKTLDVMREVARDGSRRKK
jgi:predicted transcriptional regulator